MFHCSQESFPAERICPVFTKFGSPGINGWGTRLSASQTHNVEWLPEVCLLLWLALCKVQVLGRKLWLLKLFIFLLSFLCSWACSGFQKNRTKKTERFLPSSVPTLFFFLAVLVSNRAGAPLLSRGRCWWWGGQLAWRRWPWHEFCELSRELTSK